MCFLVEKRKQIEASDVIDSKRAVSRYGWGMMEVVEKAIMPFPLRLENCVRMSLLSFLIMQ